MKERNLARLQWTILEERDDFAFQLFAAVDFNDCA